MANAIINSAGTGDVTIQAAPGAGRRIRVQGYFLIANGTDTVYFADGNDTVPLTGPLPLVAQAGVVCPGYDPGWFDLSTNSPLLLHKASAVQVSGHVRIETLG